MTVNQQSQFVQTLQSLKPFEQFMAVLLASAMLLSGTYIAYSKNKGTFIEIPRQGGKFVEGIIGTPRFINPLLAMSQADKDLTALVYAGLMVRDKNGELIPELAESYSISEDGTVYTFTLREGLTFHDGMPLTTDDVVFTVKQAADPAVRSPIYANWDGVLVEKVNERTVTFTLPEPYAPFIENMTLGILPSHIWSLLAADEFPFSQFNITPIGAGPYMITQKDVIRDRSGIPSKYRLTRFETYSLGTPFISTIEFVLFNNMEEAVAAYTNRTVHAISGVSPSRLEVLQNDGIGSTAIYRTPLLRVFGVFFNHNKQPVFLHDEVREALDTAAPKKAIVGEILRGYGSVLDRPLPDSIAGHRDEAEAEETASSTKHNEGADNEDSKNVSMNNIERARGILEHAGWKRGDDGIYGKKDGEENIRLSFTLSTIDTPELAQATERIAESWREMGAEVEVKVFKSADLTQSVIRPRRFDALFFGMVIGHELDLYAFWHSSQRNDPGLNIAQYADIESDALLEKMRTETDAEVRRTLYQEFANLVEEQHAAVFVYAPDLVYVINGQVENVSIHPVKDPSERFDTIHRWHVESDMVWPFIKNVLAALAL